MSETRRMTKRCVYDEAQGIKGQETERGRDEERRGHVRESPGESVGEEKGRGGGIRNGWMIRRARVEISVGNTAALIGY